MEADGDGRRRRRNVMHRNERRRKAARGSEVCSAENRRRIYLIRD
jgi:hypothetical protein